MILAIDVGNTNISIGMLQDGVLLASYRLTTKIDRTSDEFGMLFLDILESKNQNAKDVEDVIISSVVPNLNHSLNSAIIKYFNRRPLLIGPGLKTGLAINIEDPKSVGADQIGRAHV